MIKELVNDLLSKYSELYDEIRKDGKYPENINELARESRLQLDAIMNELLKQLEDKKNNSIIRIGLNNAYLLNRTFTEMPSYDEETIKKEIVEIKSILNGWYLVLDK